MGLTRVTSDGITDLAIVNADINASANIAGSKISPSFTSDITITNSSPSIDFVDAQQNPDFHIENNNGVFEIVDTTNSQTIAKFENAKTTFVVNVDADAGLDVTGNITVSGTVDGVDLQTLNAAVAANSAKVSNATHTGAVTGATTLNIVDNAVTLSKLFQHDAPGYIAVNNGSDCTVNSFPSHSNNGDTFIIHDLQCNKDSSNNDPVIGAAGGGTNLTFRTNQDGSSGAGLASILDVSGLQLGRMNKYVKLAAPVDTSGQFSYTFTFPATDGLNQQFLQTDGNGVTTWATVDKTQIESPDGTKNIDCQNNFIEISGAVNWDNDPNNTYGISFDAPTTLTKDSNYTLPEDGSNGQFLKTNGSGVLSFATVNTDLVTDTSPQLGANLDGNGFTANFTANNTGLGLPIGTDANEPSASSSKGYIRFNDDDDGIYFSDGSNWIKMTTTTPVLSSVSGNIFVSTATNLTLSGSGFMSSGLVVNFSQSSDSIDTDVTVTPSSDSAATVAVPAAVYNNVTANNAVTIKVTNSDGKASGTVNKTAVALPSGGSISTSGSFRIHTFTSSGTFVNTIASNSVEYLVVAGGGGGGNTVAFGVSGSSGGGAGGYRSSVSGENSGGGASAESALTLSAGNYTVTIGGGGSGTSSHATGSNGNNSVFGSITSIGGGGGGGGSGTAGNGGSGGGKAYSGGVGTGTSGQGHDGGSHAERGGGGGGGAGAVGATGGNPNGGNGGAGVSSSINGSATTRAGGGGGSGSSSGSGGSGGSGGGGNGTGNSGTGGSGSTNKGGGGGGTGPGGGTSGSGGSGIVIVRYTL